MSSPAKIFMCGISGFIGQGNREILGKMNSALRHRGPDEEGFFIKDRVYLGSRRLSIIDLSTGRQPIFNEDKSIAVVFNGEIYNFQDLRRQLEERGHKFYSQSDTEVIVHLYEDSGEAFLNGLNGMLALALWDGKGKKLILARDRFGEKPLYYSFSEGDLIFASELKAILANPRVKREIDPFALAKYLNYQYIPFPQTIFKNIYKLGPGEYLVYQNGTINKKRYWDIKFSSKLKTQNSKTSEGDYLDELDKQLERAVRMRLVSDVPLGVWLSGGLDSAAIAYYAQKNSIKSIKTFSVGFADSSFDESGYARLVAGFLRTDHRETILTSQNCLDLIPKIAEFLDEPLADASIVPTYLLSKFTKENVTVSLGGDGGDELFMGYPTFQAHQLAKIYQKVPYLIRKNIIAPIVNRLPTSFDDFSFDFKLKKFISGFEYQPEIRDQIWMGAFQPRDFKNLFSPKIYQEIKSCNIFENTDNYLRELGGEPLENRLIYLYFKNYLQENCLVKTDRASMAASLEVRSPFLDYELAEFVNSIPSSLKLKGLTTKYLFKKLMQNYLPKNIVWRRKKGFGMPLARWLRGDLKDLTCELLSQNKLEQEGIFNYSYVNRLLEEHFSGKKDNRMLIWALIIFEMWQNKWAK